MFGHLCSFRLGRNLQANNIPNVFNGKASTSHPTFQTPTAMFANKYYSQPQCERCWLTVQTISQVLKVSLRAPATPCFRE